MKISVFGTGYVGLVTGVCFAEMGNEVLCVDIDSDKIKKLSQGVSPLYEPGLEALLASNLKDSRLQFTTDLQKAVIESDFLFIAVGTPSDRDGSADLNAVLEVAETIAMHLNGFKRIITKSTVPVGTALKVKDRIESTLKRRKVSFDFDIISNPEFLKEGSATQDCLKPSRIIIGCETDRAKESMQSLYEPFLKNGHQIFFMDLASSEMTKYAANAMLATKISFMNELSRVCEKLGVDIEKIRLGIGSDPRIGPEFLYAGLGYGGSCFPKDVKALIKTGESCGEKLHLLNAVEKTNQLQQERFFKKIQDFFKHSLLGKKIAIWGLSFKPDTDDIREAPSLALIRKLLTAKAQVSVFDPIASLNAKKDLGMQADQVVFAQTPYDALQQADALCIATEWKQFRELQFSKLKSLMIKPVIFDGRNIYDTKRMAQEGITYFTLGRNKDPL